MGYLLAVTSLLALAAPIVHARSWGVPFGLLSVRMVLRTTIGTALATGLGGLLALGVLTWTSLVPPAERTAVAASAGGLVGLGLLLVSVTRLRRLRGALLLAHRLREPEVRDAALAALHALVAQVRPTRAGADHRPYADLILLIVAPMTQARMWGEAERLLDEIPADRIDVHQRALRAQALATCRLRRDDVEGARACLSEVERPSSDPGLEAWLRMTEALLLSIEGKADEALRLVDEEAHDGDRLLKASARIVRAHAYAAQGRVDRAEDELRAVEDEVGAVGLERAIHPSGPATQIARAIRRDLQ